jgi:hypothetical protein
MTHPLLLDAVARGRVLDILRDRAHDRRLREATNPPVTSLCARLHLPWYRQTTELEVCPCGQTA